MPFLTEKELRKKNKLIDKYLKNREILRKRLLEEKIGEQQLQTAAAKKYKPITEKLEEAQKNQLTSIENLQDQLIAPAIEEKKRPIYDVDFEKDFTEEDKKLLEDQGFNPNVNSFVGEKTVEEIEHLINEAILANRSYGGKMRKAEFKEEYRKLTKVNKKYYKTLRRLVDGLSFVREGRGLGDPNKLCERLNLLVSAKQAGNNNKRLNVEINKILTKLKTSKQISETEFQKLCNLT